MIIIPPVVGSTDFRKEMSKYMSLADSSPVVIKDKVNCKVLVNQEWFNLLSETYELYLDGILLDEEVRNDDGKPERLSDIKKELLAV